MDRGKEVGYAFSSSCLPKTSMMPSLAPFTVRLTFSLALFAPLAGSSAEKKLPPLPASRQPVFRPAYPPSPAILGVTFDDTTTRTEAPGSVYQDVTCLVFPCQSG